MLLRLPPTHSAVTKYMTRVDYRQRPHALLPARHENSGDHIPHRKCDSRTVYVSSLSSCGSSTEAPCFTTHQTWEFRRSYTTSQVGFADSVRFFLVELWVFDRGPMLLPVRHENSGVIYCHIYMVSDSQTEQWAAFLVYWVVGKTYIPRQTWEFRCHILPYLHGPRFTDRTMSSISCLLSCGKDIYPRLNISSSLNFHSHLPSPFSSRPRPLYSRPLSSILISFSLFLMSSPYSPLIDV